MNTRQDSNSLQHHYEFALSTIKGREGVACTSEEHGRRLDEAVTEIQSKLRVWVDWHVAGRKHYPIQLEEMVAEACNQFINHCLSSDDAMPCCDELLEKLAERAVMECSSKAACGPTSGSAVVIRRTTLRQSYELIADTIKNRASGASIDEKQWHGFDEALFFIRTNLQLAIRCRVAGTRHTPKHFDQLVTVALGRLIENCHLSEKSTYCEVLIDRIAQDVVSEFLSRKLGSPGCQGHGTTLQQDFELILRTVKSSEIPQPHPQRFEEALLNMQTTLHFAIEWHIHKYPHTREQFARLETIALRKFLTRCLFSEKPAHCEPLLEEIAESVVTHFATTAANRREPTTLQQDYEYIRAAVNGSGTQPVGESHWPQFDQAIFAIRTNLGFGIR
jgi:hypothetical protein